VTDGAAGLDELVREKQLERSSLAQLRLQELRCSCEVLGAKLHTLPYRDSGMPGSVDNEHPQSLARADLEDVARDLALIMRKTRPHVVITHDPTGLYFHPDHIKVNHAVRRAFVLAGRQTAPDVVNDGGRDLWQPAGLYYMVIRRKLVTWFCRFLRLLGKDPKHFGENGDLDLTQVGVPDELIAAWVDVGSFLPVKERASACHQSQRGSDPQQQLPRLIRRRLMRYEPFVQAYPHHWERHSDLFAGLDLASLEDGSLRLEEDITI